MQRTFVLGDIHGELESLLEVLDKSKFDFDKDKLIQIGDVCDRGGNSFQCVEVLKRVVSLVAIRGNHDKWLLDAMHGGMPYDPYWLKQGGYETLDSYKAHGVHCNYHSEFYESQVPYYIEDNRCFVHAGFDRDFPIDGQDEKLLMWDRYFADDMMRCAPGERLKTFDNFDEVFIGHTPTIYWENFTKPIMKGGVINIDTGSGKGGKLTIMDINTKQYWQSDLQTKD